MSHEGAANATLVVHSGALKNAAVIAQHGALSFVIDPLPAFGEELWLRALALGAGALVLVDDPMLAPKSRQAIESCVAQMHTLLSTFGMARERLVWLTETDLPIWLDAQGAKLEQAAKLPGAQSAQVIEKPAIRPSASPSWARYKRLAWIDGLRLLGTVDGVNAVVALPVGATFGQVRVNQQRCTLCFACANLCPTRALKANNAQTQQLAFQESACVQCRLCVQGCPEKAISIHARFAPQVLAQMTATVLQQGEQVACTSCGTPFISRRLLASSLARLKGHPTLAKGGQEALMTCPTCRQREMLSVA